MKALAQAKVLLLGFIMVGLLLIVGSLGLCWINSGTTSWPKIEGHVLSTATAGVLTDSGEAISTRIIYFYELEGMRYQNDRIRFGFVTSSGRYLGLRNGDKITVHVNLSDPTQSVLETGVSFADIVLLILGVFAVGISGISLRLILRSSTPIIIGSDTPLPP